MLLKSIMAAILGIAIAGQPARAQSAGELLQKGIYTQETVGDLDGAIRIYRQILTGSAESRAYAAQAQYRLGLCLQAKGDSAGAAQAFRKLVKEYPEQKELLAKAQRKLPRINLAPGPWPDHEYAEYRIVANGSEVSGTIVDSIEPSPNSPNRLILASRNSTAPAWYRVEVDRETLAPVSAWFKMGDNAVQTEYQDGLVRMTVQGKPPRNLPVENGLYDGQSFPFVIRRLPLEENYKASFPILSEVGIPMPLEAKVKALEDVEVPAGKFHCFKVVVDVSPVGAQTFWYTTDASHTMAKFSIGTVDIELTHISTTGPEPTTHRGENGAVSFVAPAAWIVDKPEVNGDVTEVSLTDPEGQSTYTRVYSMREKIAPSEIDAFLRTRTAMKEKYPGDGVKNGYKIRPESVQRFQLKGYEALRAVAEYTTENKQPKVDWMTFVRTENTRMTIWGQRIDPADLDKFVERFQPIVDSLIVP